MTRFFALTVVLAFSGAALAQRAPLTDHPLIAPYTGSELRHKDVKDFDEYTAFVGMDDSGKEPLSLVLEGRVTRLRYRAPKGRSILEVFRNYQNAIDEGGGEVMHICDQSKKECVERYAGPTLQKLAGITAISNSNGRYLLAKLTADTTTAYVAIAVGQISTEIHVVEVKSMDTGMVTLDAAALGRGLDAKGYVVVDGIFFDSDKATLKDESTAALTEVAALLAARPSLEVYVVGHTDMQGELDYNRALSDRRARAVVEELVSTYSIKRSRLAGFGVGPLAPQASNDSDAGRAKNRRVVLVAR